MTSSGIAEYDQNLDSAIDSLQLSRACTNKLSPSQVENMKTNVVLANEAIATAGNAVRASAAALYEIKKDVKNKNWTALTESGALQMSGRMARDLVKAYESWIRDSDVPDEALARVSARVLARIGSVDAGKRTHAINKIKRGEGYTEQDLTKIIGNTIRFAKLRSIPLSPMMPSVPANPTSTGRMAENASNIERKSASNTSSTAAKARIPAWV